MSTWIDRYVAQVGRNLPQNKRSDIEKEIRSLVEDMLEDRSQVEGRAVDEEMTLAVLQEMGEPGKVAAGYLPEKYLIGPRIYPLFMLVLRIVLIVMAGVALFGLVISIGKNPMTYPEVIKAIGEMVVDYASTALQILGNLVLVFVILQWTMPKMKIELHDEHWNPRELEPVEDPKRVKRFEKLWDIVFALVGLLLFNFYSEYVGIYNLVDGKLSFAPLLADRFFTYLPLFNIYWILGILLNAVLMRRGQWDPPTRWASIGLSLFNIALCSNILVTGPQKLFTIGSLGVMGIPPEAGDILTKIAQQGLVVVFALIIVLEGFKIVQSLLSMYKK